jgi:hypothetical protein
VGNHWISHRTLSSFLYFKGAPDEANEGRVYRTVLAFVPHEYAVVLASVNDKPAVALTRHH